MLTLYRWNLQAIKKVAIITYKMEDYIALVILTPQNFMNGLVNILAIRCELNILIRLEINLFLNIVIHK